MHFKRLRLSGFKSFVDPTELVIEPGLTGIVGPNGCGKSNLLEALRWVMGETSSKSLRGTGMEDVIFAGSGGRPARHFADVSLLLDNSDRTAPAAFNDTEELEIHRRIERDLGSAYRVNGKDVRQRDVQLIFADNASGAHSPALVSQGRIGAIIAAKPSERRVVLEEAAGISGLYSRRNEAEQRLRAAEANLARLVDVAEAMDTQIAVLKRQARQAVRYRELSADIRQAEGLVFYSRWQTAAAALLAAEQELAVRDAEVGDLTSQSAHLAAQQSEVASTLPALRQAEAEAAAALQIKTQQIAALDQELIRIDDRRKQLAEQVASIRSDQQREQSLHLDTQTALARLSAEQKEVTERLGATANKQKHAADAVRAAAQLASEGESRFDELTRRNADTSARKRVLESQIEAAHQRLARLQADFERLTQDRAALEAEATASPIARAQADLASAQQEKEATATALGTAESTRSDSDANRERMRLRADVARQALRTQLDTARQSLLTTWESRTRTARQQAEASRQAARRAFEHLEREQHEHVRQAETLVAGLRTELDVLTRLLNPTDMADDRPRLDAQIKVTPGYEAALAAALADDLAAPIGGERGRRWTMAAQITAHDPSLPATTASLAQFVVAPLAISRRLAQIAVLDDLDDAADVIAQLAVGQRLVSRSGALWRWDGFHAPAGSATSAAERLEQANRRTEVEVALAQAEASYSQLAGHAEQTITTAREALRAATAAADAEIATNDEAARLAYAEAEASAQTAWTALEAQLATEMATVQAVLDACTRAEQLARDARDAAYRRFEQASYVLSSMLQESNKRDARLQGIADTQARIAEERQARKTDMLHAQELIAGLPDLAHLAIEIADQRRIVEHQRQALAQARASLDGIERQVAGDENRAAAIVIDITAWRKRQDDAVTQLATLEARAAQAQQEEVLLAARPAMIEEERGALINARHLSEEQRQLCADKLAAAEQALRRIDTEARDINASLSAARERRGRLIASVEHEGRRRDEAQLALQEHFQIAPEAVLTHLGLSAEYDPPHLSQLEPALDKLKAERERLGAVNLLAEQELETLTSDRLRLQSESDELETAIAKLRGAIGALNREGRQRLLAAFEAVNGHFKTLFATLFGGGEAHLALIESDDPLHAGLELFAAPPGKKVANLSLLSGGEQALTATALIFALFLTNPAPICVLDEVDAPLDDANVERFCDLLDDMAARTRTRFLIVTHNAVTMSRMDRLFGVTMAERGVSQLVSVALHHAEQLLAAE